MRSPVLAQRFAEIDNDLLKGFRDFSTVSTDPGVTHMDDNPYTSLAKTEGSPAYCCSFQLADVRNHETWVLIAWTNALTLLVVGLSA